MDQRTPETTPNYTLKDEGLLLVGTQQQEFHTLLDVIDSDMSYQTSYILFIRYHEQFLPNTLTIF